MSVCFDTAVFVLVAVFLPDKLTVALFDKRDGLLNETVPVDELPERLIIGLEMVLLPVVATELMRLMPSVLPATEEEAFKPLANLLLSTYPALEMPLVFLRM